MIHNPHYRKLYYPIEMEQVHLKPERKCDCEFPRQAQISGVNNLVAVCFQTSLPTVWGYCSDVMVGRQQYNHQQSTNVALLKVEG